MEYDRVFDDNLKKAVVFARLYAGEIFALR